LGFLPAMNAPAVERPPSLEELNSAGRDEFVAALAHVFEDSPWVAEGAWEAHPFDSLEELWASMCDVVARAGEGRQLALIRAHPELAGRALEAGRLSTSSTSEQHALGLHRLTPEQSRRVASLSAEYRRRHGFLCIVCVREHDSVEGIVSAMERRLDGTREAEVAANLEEIGKIARYRLGIGSGPGSGG
jgi:2-oxo-4-hydroxy-4-carboxy-5-ureidoimidazoline decarboxylase